MRATGLSFRVLYSLLIVERLQFLLPQGLYYLVLLLIMKKEVSSDQLQRRRIPRLIAGFSAQTEHDVTLSPTWSTTSPFLQFPARSALGIHKPDPVRSKVLVESEAQSGPE
jgi:hypothetical protein